VLTGAALVAAGAPWGVISGRPERPRPDPVPPGGSASQHVPGRVVQSV